MIKPVYVDIDDTLAMWDLSAYPTLHTSVVFFNGDEVRVKLNQKNINLVRKFHKMGYEVVLWSQTGKDWAEAVANAAGLTDIVHTFLTKPRYYIDDLPSSEFMGTRVWRDPITGESR